MVSTNDSAHGADVRDDELGAGRPRVGGPVPPDTLRRRLGRLLHRLAPGRTSLAGPVITCEEVTAFLARYVEDGLSPEERKAFDRHVAMCHACRAYVESYARTIELEGLAFEDPEALALSDVPEELVQGILAARRLRVTGDSRRAARAAQEALRPRREAGGRS